MREWPDLRKMPITSAIVLSMSIASMSARGIMTSSTVMSPSFRMARSMVRSSADSVAPAASSAAIASSISARAEPFGFTPSALKSAALIRPTMSDCWPPASAGGPSGLRPWSSLIVLRRLRRGRKSPSVFNATRSNCSIFSASPPSRGHSQEGAGSRGLSGEPCGLQAASPQAPPPGDSFRRQDDISKKHDMRAPPLPAERRAHWSDSPCRGTICSASASPRRR